MHIAFENAGKQAGLEIWRIEQFNPVPYPKTEYGKFYTGDSYIMLYTKKQDNKFSWDIHFWLGSETTQDESGTAAILSVDLDDHLGGTPVQYREVQDHESQKFLNHFKNGVRYLPGGIQTGFQRVDKTKIEKKLFQVKGIKNIRVKQVEMSVKSMNKGDCFILDADTTIYVYVGAKSKRMERLKAIQAANQIRDQDHGGRSKVVIVDEYGSGSDLDKFFKVMGSGSAGEISDEDAGGDDSEFENNEECTVCLYKVSDNSGNMKVDKVGQKPLSLNLLDSNDCFILDTGRADVFVWIGKNCNNNEKKEAMNHAQQFLKTKNYPVWTRVQRVVDGGESAAFQQYFSGQGGQAKLVHIKIHDNGKMTMETLTDFDQDDLDEDDVMVLDSGKEVFLWVGKDSSEDESQQGMKIAQNYLRRAGYAGSVKTVKQGSEPSPFTSVFPKWKANHWASAPSYVDRLKSLLK